MAARVRVEVDLRQQVVQTYKLMLRSNLAGQVLPYEPGTTRDENSHLTGSHPFVCISRHTVGQCG